MVVKVAASMRSIWQESAVIGAAIENIFFDVCKLLEAIITKTDFSAGAIFEPYFTQDYLLT
jgi:hypothetical protein